MQGSMLSATQLGTYTKFTLKQEATMLAILHVLSATLANCGMASYRTWGAYAAGDDVNVFCVNSKVESGHVRLAKLYKHLIWEVMIFG